MGNLYHTTGSVGIGTTTPLVPLDVQGGSVRVNRNGSFEQSVAFSSATDATGWARGLFFVDGTASDTFTGITGGIGMYRSGAAASTSLFMGWGVSPWVSPLGIHVRQNPLTVGIGTPSPTVKLDVNGGVNVSGTLSVDETSGFTAGDITCSDIQYTSTLGVGVTIAPSTATSGPRYASAKFKDYNVTGSTYIPTVTQHGKLVVITGLIQNDSTSTSASGTVMVKGLPPPNVYNLFSAHGPSNNNNITRININTSGELTLGEAWTGASAAANGNGNSWISINCCYFTA